MTPAKILSSPEIRSFDRLMAEMQRLWRIAMTPRPGTAGAPFTPGYTTTGALDVPPDYADRRAPYLGRRL